MDADSIRYLLIAAAAAFAISLNIPWRHCGRTLTRCANALLTSPPAQHSSSRGFRSPGKLPWLDIGHGSQALAVVPVAREQAPRRARVH